MNPRTLHEMVTDAGCPPDEAHELAQVLAPLASPAAPAPSPSPALAALFGETGGQPDRPPAAVRPLAGTRTTPGVRTRTSIAGAVVLAVASVGATGLSAAANSLPGAVQHRVSEFSRHYLPFDFPEPPRHEEQPLGQAPLVEPPGARPQPAAGTSGSREVHQDAGSQAFPAAPADHGSESDRPRDRVGVGSKPGRGPGAGQAQTSPKPRPDSSSSGSGTSSAAGAGSPEEVEGGSTATPPATQSPEKPPEKSPEKTPQKAPVQAGLTRPGLVTGWDKEPGQGDEWHDVRDRSDDRFQGWHGGKDDDRDDDRDRDPRQHEGHGRHADDPAVVPDSGQPRGIDPPALR